MNYRAITAYFLIAGLLLPSSAFAAIINSNENFRRASSEWYRGSSEIRDAVNDLGDDRVDALPIPVLFGVAVRNLTKNFGDARGTNRTHEGLDIMAPEGMPVIAPTESVVVRTGDGASSGKYVTLAAPGEESFVFMHLSAIADIDEGDVLKAGDIIGYVGHTGNAIAAAPHLHFEIHNDEGVAMDPFPRLTTVFKLEDKIDSLEDAFNDTSKDGALAALIVLKARSEINAALAQGIKLPQAITDELKKTSVVTTSSAGSSSTVLKVGSRGTAVKALQEFLVRKGVGSASRVVPDGAFGPITRQAVIDYQASVGLVADGVAGPKTLSYIALHP